MFFSALKQVYFSVNGSLEIFLHTASDAGWYIVIKPVFTDNVLFIVFKDFATFLVYECDITFIIKGQEHPDIKRLLSSAVIEIEKNHSHVLEKWMGRQEDVAGVQEIIDRLSEARFQVRRVIEGVNLENYGVEPDIYVENHPEDEAAGDDPQLRRAVDELLKQLREK